MNVVRDAPPHGYSQWQGETYYWYIEDGSVEWRLLEHDEVPNKVKRRTEYIADVRGWYDE